MVLSFVVVQSEGTASLRTRKFLTNRLLQRKQMVCMLFLLAIECCCAVALNRPALIAFGTGMMLTLVVFFL